MNSRSRVRRVGALPVSEGAGVTVRRTIGLPTLRHLDPFLLLDHFSSDDPEEYIAGFPDHPHRGFVTLTYMLEGHMEHRDSLGNCGDLRAGSAQWMKAASGVIHSEMPRQTEGLLRGFQLWINLPAAEKMSDPAYQEIAAAMIPRVDEAGTVVRVLSGDYAGHRGPIDDPYTRLRYLDIGLPPGRLFRPAVEPGLNAFVYVFEGDARTDGVPLATHELAVLGADSGLEITAGNRGTRFILAAARPLGEPIVQYGPFVMTSREEVEQALADFRDDRLVRKAATITG